MTDIDGLFKAFSSLEQVEAIALGGSRAGEVYDEKSDYDVYLYCLAPVPVSVREKNCKILPENFRSNLEKLFSVMFAKPGNIAPVLGAVISELEKILPA